MTHATVKQIKEKLFCEILRLRKELGKAVAVALLLLALSASGFGYEHKLQFNAFIPYNPVVGPVTVIGERFNTNSSGNIVSLSGSIHFTTVPSGCRYICPRTSHDWTGTWDLDGNLLSVAQTPWGAQQPIGIGSSTTPLAETNNEAIYAEGILPNNNVITTGQDALYRYGYVDTIQSHYTWSQTTIPVEYVPGHFVIPRTPPFVFSLSLMSDGDLPLNITSTIAQVTASGYYTNGTGTATYMPQPGDCLSAPVTPGTSCVVQISFDPSTIISTGSPYGYAYNNFSLALASDAGNLADFLVAFTITGFSAGGE